MIPARPMPAELQEDMAVADFVLQHNIQIYNVRTPFNLNMPHMPLSSRHWRSSLFYNGREMTITFSQGPGLLDSPTAEDVLDCLAGDSSSVEYMPLYETWARDMGHEVGDPATRRLYDLVSQQAKKLRAFLGEAVFDQLLWHTERMRD